ncbi:MAG: 50S ribosomal protein L21e [Candidatus Aenigmarchaeota archaeon]|nr:50S ribosomal protein L21e [Candidatus Aenigmarchaeota archaeon]MDI6722912.1 50S ribosomal protein L21e [Candidatus Aenigmarchaeota archaeon]
MVRKSYGKMRGTRLKLRSGQKLSITKYIQKFNVNDKVHIGLVPSSPIQHPRFQGKTGIIKEKRGNSYRVEINDGRKSKYIFLRPEHLKLAK